MPFPRNSLLNNVYALAETVGDVDADDAALVVFERVEVAERLGRFQDAEGVRLAGDSHIVPILAGELDEDAVVCAAFVQLARGMQEARAVADGGGHLIEVAQADAQGFQRAFRLRVLLHVGHDGDIVAGLDLAQEGMQVIGQAARAVFGAVDGDVPLLDDRRRLRQLALLFVLRQNVVRVLLALLDVGFVEGIDVQDVACGGDGELPEEELRPQIVVIAQIIRDFRLTGGDQRLDGVVELRILAAIEAQVDEDAIVAIVLWPAQLLAGDRDEAAPLLAGTLGDQLLDPEAEAGDAGGEGKGDLVAPLLRCQRSQGRAKPEAGVILRRMIGPAFLHHLLRPREQLLDVDADQRAGDEAEVGERGIAAPDIRRVGEDVPEVVISGKLLQRRAGIGNGDETLPGIGSDQAADFIIEVFELRQRFQRLARFRGDDEEGGIQIDLPLHRENRIRVGGVEDEEFQVAGCVTEGEAQHFRAEAAAAHAEQHGALVACLPHPVDETADFVALLLHQVGDRQPAQALADGRLRLRFGFPERGVPIPDALSRVLPRQLLQPALNDGLETVGATKMGFQDHDRATPLLVRCLLRRQSLLFGVDGLEEIVERVGELLHALDQQLVRDLSVADADGFQRLKQGNRAGDIVVDGDAGVAVIAEVLDGFQRHGINGIGADQFFGVHDIAVGRVLRAGAGPQRSLHHCAAMLERLEARRVEDFLEILVDQAGIGDTGLALKRFESLLLGGVARCLDALVKQLIDERVDAADEEAGDRGDAADILSLRVAILQRVQIGIGNLAIDLTGEDEGDVDVDAFGEGLAHGGDALWRGWNLNHQIGPVNHLPETAHLLERAFGVVGEVGRNFQADVAIVAARAVIDGTQHIGDGTDIGYHQRLVDLAGAFALTDQLIHLLIVSVSLADGFIENGGVRGDAGDAVLYEQVLKHAILQLRPVDIVIPDALSQGFQFAQRIGHICLLVF